MLLNVSPPVWYHYNTGTNRIQIKRNAVWVTERHSSFFVVSHQYHVVIATGKEAKK